MRQIPLILPAMLASTLSSQAMALDVAAGSAINMKTHSFEIKGNKLEPEFTTLDLNLALIHQGFYLRANYDQSLRDEVDNYRGSLFFSSRKDYGFTLGYNIAKNLSLFLGQQTGITEMANANLGSASDNFVTTFRFVGPYAGLSYSIPFKSHSLGISLAYADMEGTVTIEDPAAGQRTKQEGDTVGLSYSVQLSGPFSQDMGYSVYAKINKYDFDDTNGGEDWSTKETFTIYGVSLLKYF